MDLSWILGHAKTSFYHSAKTVPVLLKNGKKQLLADFCKERTPPCRLNPLLFNGHLQTAWAASNNGGPPISYKRKVFESESDQYPGSFAVDFVVQISSPTDKSLPSRTTYFSKQELDNIGSTDSKPMLIALPGLSGGSNDLYLRQTLSPLVKDQGWEACVVNQRGCAMSKVTSNFLYNARSTWDLRQVVLWLKARFPNRPLFGIGFSIGANLLTNYTGEEGSDCLLAAAVSCSNPWNLDAAALSLRRTWLGLQVYSKSMGAKMKNIVETHKHEVLKNRLIDPEEVRKIKYLHEFDRVVQCPTWGYPTEGAYYRDASSIDSIFAIKIPFLAINAENDPISVTEAIPYPAFAKNPHTILCSTTAGGHLGWYEIGGQSWLPRMVVSFLNGIAEDVDPKSMGPDSIPLPIHSSYDPMRRPIEVPTSP